jgi:peptide subunit release factor 1 (eRF1)
MPAIAEKRAASVRVGAGRRPSARHGTAGASAGAADRDSPGFAGAITSRGNRERDDTGRRRPDMITRDSIDALVNAVPASQPVTSVYLDTDSRRHSGTEYSKTLEQLFEAKRAELGTSDVSRERERAILDDFAKIREWVAHRPRTESTRGLAIFSAAGAGYWQALALPRRVPDLVVVDEVPYSRPLAVLADEFERFCAVAVDRHRGRVFEIFMGEIEEIADLVDDVPKKARKTGHALKSETSFMRHVDEQWRLHWVRIADRVRTEDRRRHFDRLILAGPPQDLAEFERMLHSTLQRKVASRISVSVGLDSTPQDVLRQVRDVEATLEREREAKLVDGLMNQARSGKLGVVGLAETLKALNAGQVHTLVLEDGLRADGVSCPSCRFLGVVGRACPTCDAPTRSERDVVDLAVAEAMRQGCEVRHLVSIDALRSLGGIGALLRFRV